MHLKNCKFQYLQGFWLIAHNDSQIIFFLFVLKPNSLNFGYFFVVFAFLIFVSNGKYFNRYRGYGPLARKIRELRIRRRIQKDPDFPPRVDSVPVGPLPAPAPLLPESMTFQNFF